MIKKTIKPKTRKRTITRRRGIAVPSGKMQRFEFLTGDVNWKDYGGVWYRRIDPHIYYLIEFINFPNATGELYNGNKYVVTGEIIDLNPGTPWYKEIPNATRSYDISDTNELLTLEAVHGYMGGDREFAISGNNAEQLLADAKRRLS